MDSNLLKNLFPDIVLFFVMVLQVMICPFTKVEESFNLQAIHDVLHHKWNISEYDHLEFPGVVPRTFIGPLFISSLSFFPVYLMKFFGIKKLYMQYIIRIVLGLAVIVSFRGYRKAIQKVFGANVSLWLVIITSSQFHFVFYMSRPLPNTFALITVLLCLSWWIEGEFVKFIWSSAFVILIFRAELCILLGFLMLRALFVLRSLNIRYFHLLLHCVSALFVWISLTVMVDSFFWQRVLWPEGEVFWYNTFLNKSSNWGKSPFLWYFYSVIPRIMMSSLVYVPLGLYYERKMTRNMFLPAAAFIFLYSFLPHKELRFIIYTFPIFNTFAAIGCSRLWCNFNKSITSKIFALSALAHIFLNMGLTSILLYISHWNYPGGVALQTLHQLETPFDKVHVHIDVAAAQTGISRFGQLNDLWIYNKTENIIPGDIDESAYTHLLKEFSNKNSKNFLSTSTHYLVTTIRAYSHISVGKQFPFLHVHLSPRIEILKKQKDQ